MEFSESAGSLGVALLLIAFGLNLFRFIGQGNWWYLLLNFSGAGLACYASWLIGFIPFVVLEGTWALVAFIGLIKRIATRSIA